MRTTVTEYYCDICHKQVSDANRLTSILFPVIYNRKPSFYYDDSYNVNCKTLTDIDMCRDCKDKYINFIIDNYVTITMDKDDVINEVKFKNET